MNIYNWFALLSGNPGLSSTIEPSSEYAGARELVAALYPEIFQKGSDDGNADRKPHADYSD